MYQSIGRGWSSPCTVAYIFATVVAAVAIPGAMGGVAEYEGRLRTSEGLVDYVRTVSGLGYLAVGMMLYNGGRMPGDLAENWW